MQKLIPSSSSCVPPSMYVAIPRFYMMLLYDVFYVRWCSSRTTSFSVPPVVPCYHGGCYTYIAYPALVQFVVAGIRFSHNVV